MEPELEELSLVGDGLLMCRTHTLEDLADIAQVEGVVRLVGRGLQAELNTGIYDFGSFNELIQSTLDVLIEALEEAAQNLAKDHRDGLRVEIGVGQEVVMTLEARREGRTTTAGWSHGRNENNILDSLEILLLTFTVVPAFMVKPLADELNRRLREVNFPLGHVQVINEDDELLASGWAEHTLSTLLKLLIETVLRLVGAGLSREGDRDHRVLLRHLLVEHVNDVDGLTDTGGTWRQDVLTVEDEQLLDVLHSDGIECWHDDLSVLGSGVNGVLTDGLVPPDPLLVSLLIAVVVDRSFKRHTVFIVLAHELAHVVAETFATLRRRCAANRPDDGEDEKRLEHLLKILNLSLCDNLGISVLIDV